MWNKFTIKTQLLVFVSIVILLTQFTTLFSVLRIQKSQNTQNIILEEKAIIKSLNNDFLKYLLTPKAEVLSDINLRLSAFKKINGVVLYNEFKEPIYKYKNDKDILKNIKLLVEETLFKENNLFIKNNIQAEGHIFGYVVLDVNLENYKKRENNIIFTILMIIPFVMLIGFILSLYLSKLHNKPFLQLLKAMKESNPTENKIVKLKTSARNEVRELFKGFNKQMEQIALSSIRLQYIANHDQLTNIYNRFYIEKQLENVLLNESKSLHSLFYIDIDQFKLINDSLGNQTKDELLKMIVIHYQMILPQKAIFARIDGDGFLVLLKDTTKEESTKLLEESLEALKDFRFSNENETFSVSASISLIYFNSFEFTVEELLKASSHALYMAKSKGKNKYHIYDPSDELIKRVSVERNTAKLIKDALENNTDTKFELFAQNIVPLEKTSDKYSYEILIRMKDKENNFTSPANFLPAAERYNLMSEIDTFVLWTYLETITKNKEHLKNLHKVHINLAGSSLNNLDFKEKVKEAIELFNFPWEKLEFEITESSAIGSFNKANKFISYLKSKKIGLALDDFGTGMASFEYLKSLPFDTVKIDGSFIKDMHTDPTDKAVIKYIQEIANLKNQETVAEYVETKEDVAELKKLGVTFGQGYYLGKPKPLKDWL